VSDAREIFIRSKGKSRWRNVRRENVEGKSPIVQLSAVTAQTSCCNRLRLNLTAVCR